MTIGTAPVRLFRWRDAASTAEESAELSIAGYQFPPISIVAQ
jgi:hypothetical protein